MPAAFDGRTSNSLRPARRSYNSHPYAGAQRLFSISFGPHAYSHRRQAFVAAGDFIDAGMPYLAMKRALEKPLSQLDVARQRRSAAEPGAVGYATPQDAEV
jgi:hypothetical protein